MDGDGSAVEVTYVQCDSCKGGTRSFHKTLYRQFQDKNTRVVDDAPSLL